MTTAKTRWRLLAAALVLLLGLGAFLWKVRQTPQISGAGGRYGLNTPMAVSVSSVVIGDIPVRLAALGTVTPLATVTVRTQISGQLQQVAFKEGQMVRQGDFLAQIDPRPWQNALTQAEGVLTRDQALLANARVDLQRYQDLVAEDSVAKQQLDTQQSLVAQLVGTVATDVGQVNTAKLNLQYTHIVAPVSGRAGLRQVDVGNYVTPGDANGIVVITQLQPITALFPIPEDDVPALMRRMHQGATLTVEVSNRSNTTPLATGSLVTVDNQIDTATGTVKLRASFDNRDEQLFPNQFVNVQLLLDTLHDQVIVPIAAIQHGAVNGVARTFVYLLNAAESTVSVRTVTTGASDGERQAIAKGLIAGDIVVTEGGDRLRDGARVQLPGAMASTTPGNPGSGRRNGRRGDGAASAGSHGGGNSRGGQAPAS